MLIHISPRVFSSYAECILNDLTIKELNLTLIGGKDIIARKPYPNKNYAVGCRKIGKKAVIGILVDTKEELASFTVNTHWAVNGKVITHQTNYKLTDNDYDTVSDDMILWYATGNSLGNWPSRWPASQSHKIPAKAQPRMDIYTEAGGGNSREGDVVDTVLQQGEIVMRVENFDIPTIERQRLFDCRITDRSSRYPNIEDAFIVA